MSRDTHRITLPASARDTRHEAFAAALRRSHVGSARWHQYWAGALVLALVDETLSRRKRAASDKDYVTVRRAIALVRAGATRARLTAILDRIVAGSPPVAELVDLVADYAARLEQTGEFEIAVDVYRLVIDAAHKAGLTNRIPYAYLRLGSCLREMAHVSAAIRAYDAGLATAVLSGDRRTELLLRVAQARLYQVNRRLEVARAILDDVLSRTDDVDSTDIRALAAHNRGVVAHQSGLVSGLDADFFATLDFLTIAWRNYNQPEQRSRVLNDIGRALFCLGMREAAQRAGEVAYRSAVERTNRWACGNNLLMMAVERNDPETFFKLRAVLGPAPMPALLRAEFLLEEADGCLAFGLVDEARAAYARAAHLAHRFGLASYVGQAEDGLAGRRPPRAEPRARPTQPPPGVLRLEHEMLSLPRQAKLSDMSSQTNMVTV